MTAQPVKHEDWTTAAVSVACHECGWQSDARDLLVADTQAVEHVREGGHAVAVTLKSVRVVHADVPA